MPVKYKKVYDKRTYVPEAFWEVDGERIGRSGHPWYNGKGPNDPDKGNDNE